MTTAVKSKTEVRPTAQQQAFIDALLDSAAGHLCLRARAGTGKCLGEGTPILMFDGRVLPVESIRRGDLLMGPDSRPREVLHANIGNGPLMRIIPVKGEPWVCNDAHVMTLQGSSREFGRVVDVPLNEHLRAWPTNPSRNWKLWRTKVDFPTTMTPIEPYMLGLWLGDGTLGEFIIHNPDREVIDYCRDFARRYALSAKVQQEPGCFKISLITGPRIGLGRPRARHPLRQFLKTFSDKYIPQQFKVNSRTARLELLAGLLDSDGSLSSGGFEISTKYQQLADDILFVARSLGLAAYKRAVTGVIKSLNFKGEYWRIFISGDCSVIPTKIRRKRAPKRTQIKRVNITGWSAEKIGSGTYYGFTLTGDGRFLLGDFTVTHNTSTILMGVDAYAAAHPDHEILVCAYNKAIADEVAAKLKARGHADWRRVQAATAHSLGFGVVRFLFKPKVDDHKVRTIIDRTVAEANHPDAVRVYTQYGAQVAALVRYAKQAGFGFFPDCAIGDTPAWHRLADHFDVNGLDDTSEADAVVEAAQQVYRLSLAQTDVVDFDDMILFPLVKNIRVKFTKDLIFVDEAQDLSRARQALIRKFLGPAGRMVIVGDDRQCHPKGTEIYVTGRGYMPIEQVKIGYQVATYSNGSFPGTASQGRRVEAVQARGYRGELIKIEAPGFGAHEVTPNHRCLVRMIDRPGSVVYVMRRGDHARVGRCKSKYGGDFGMSGRARQEKADAAWAIKFFTAEEEAEAQLLELTLAYTYGLPQLCFTYSWENGLSPKKRAQFWRDFPPNIAGLRRCLSDFGRDEALPFWAKDDGKHIGGKYSFLLTAANLQDGWMRVCAYSGHKYKPDWVTAKVSKRQFNGRVWSLKIQPTEGGRRLYIANGIITHNSIFGFTGADAAALDSQIANFRARVLPLSVTWRCPKAVVELAQKLVPDIEAAPTARDGEVLHMPALRPADGLEEVLGAPTQVPWHSDAELGPTDAVLCRNTAPLIQLAYQLIRAGKPCKVEGRAIGSGLKALAQRWKIKTIDALLKRLDAYAERERQKAIAKGNEAKAEEVSDRVTTLKEICKACIETGRHDVADVLAFIDALFADGEREVTILATYHRSKGREFPRVFLLEHAERCPSRAARQDWQRQQEQNLAYVAFTRAQQSLIFVG